MSTNKIRSIINFYLSPHNLLYGVRNPQTLIFQHLIFLVKHPALFYKTRIVKGYLKPEVGVALYEAVLRTRHESINIVEVGIYKGLSTIYLAEAARKVNRRVKSFDWFNGLTGVDPVLDSNFKDGDCISDVNDWEFNVRKNTSREIVDLTIGDALKTMLPVIKDSGFAIAFLDVDLYDVTRDLLLQLGEVARGGEVIFIHDADSPGIEMAINEFLTLRRFPVKKEYLDNKSTAKLTILPF